MFLPWVKPEAPRPPQNRIEVGMGPGHGPGGAPQEPAPPHLPRLLRLGGKGRGQRPESEPAEERAPVHHSITWSARTSNEGGIVRPRPLPDLRLKTSWNLVGCPTGRTSGFAPFRI